MTRSEIYREIKLKVKCKGMSTERSCQRSRERDGARSSIWQKRRAKENPEAHFGSSLLYLFRCCISLFTVPFTSCRHHLRFLPPPRSIFLTTSSCSIQVF